MCVSCILCLALDAGCLSGGLNCSASCPLLPVLLVRELLIERNALIAVLIVDFVFVDIPLCLWDLLSVLMVRVLIVSVVLTFFSPEGLLP